MCGIAGLHLRDPDLYAELGALLEAMMCQVADRGPDSAGIAVYGDPGLNPAGSATVTLVGGDGITDQLVELQALVSDALSGDRSDGPVSGGVRVARRGQTTVVQAATAAATLENAVRTALPAMTVAGVGESLTVLKGVGHPSQLAEQVGLRQLRGWQGVTHTRMATESVVAPEGSHPFAVGEDLCLVHNGSFSNHATIRRSLAGRGIRCDSDNDSEVAARFLAARLRDGDSLTEALELLRLTFDGFYTLLVSTHDTFAVMRDAIACKPALVAETDRWVAMASEYRALACLPGIEHAVITEPEPEEIYTWQR